MKLFKYYKSAQAGLNQQAKQRGLLLGCSFLYITIVYLFSQVFKSVGAEPIRLWYLAVTEWIIISATPAAFQIASDLKSGQVAYFSLRPIHYLYFRLSDAFGKFLVKFIILECLCLAIGYALTGFFPCKISTWLIGNFLVLAGALLYMLISMSIGLSAFWLREIDSLFYMNLTATFCFGGLIIPLAFYSPLFRTISSYTPYPSILAAPSEWMTGQSVNILSAFLEWSMWMIVSGIIMHILYNRCLKTLAEEGG